MRTIIEILIKLKNKLLKKQKRTDTTAEDEEDITSEMPIFLPVVSIIIAVLSLPFVVYAGERTFQRRLPRPAFVRRFSESVVGKKKKSDLAPIPEGVVVAEEEDERPKHERSHSDSEISPVGQRVETGFSVASDETYIRGMPLSKLGVD